MKVSVQYAVIDKALNTLMPIISDSLLAKDIKNVTLHIKEGNSKLVATSTHITSAVDIDATVEYGDDCALNDAGEKEDFVQVSAKELGNILATFKSLKRTVVSSVVFNVNDLNVVLEVNEEPIDKEMPNANKYVRTTRFMIPRLRVRGILLDEIKSVEVKPEIEGEIDSENLLLYINALLPNIAGEKRGAFNSINYTDKYIYTASSSYVAVMSNDFKEVGIEGIEGFRLQNSKCTFLKSFLSDVENVKFKKEMMAKGGVLLTVLKEGAIATLKCEDTSKIRDIGNEIDSLSTLKGIKIDKVYLLDVLKRVKLSSETINVEVDTLNRVMKLKSKTLVQELPILSNDGDEGVYKFTLKIDIIDALIFGHTNIFPEMLNMAFKTENNSVTLVCYDETGIWRTVIKGLPQQELKTDW